jgi:hypothetical protein
MKHRCGKDLQKGKFMGKSRLGTVTLTGADDKTDIDALVGLSQQFPFVEWGILLSESRTGSPRYPSQQWLDKFASVAEAKKMNVATHICGRWSREIFAGYMPIWDRLPDIVETAKRVQINGTPIPEFESEKVIEVISLHKEKDFIVQMSDRTNKLLTISRLYPYERAKIYGLVDNSGGKGKLEESWPIPKSGVWDQGFAGGLSPSNIDHQITLIEQAVCGMSFISNTFRYWIDMESGIRNDNDEFSIGAATTVLEKMNSYMKKEIE